MLKWSRAVLATLPALIVLAGAVYSLRLGNTLRFDDERDYYTIASNLARGRGFSIDGTTPTAFRPPGYPLFLAVFIAFGANVVVLRILNFVMLATSMFLLYRFALREGGRLGATAAPVICLGYPVLFYAAGTLYSQTLAGLLLLLAATTISTERLGWLPTGLILGLLLGWLSASVIPFLFSTTVVAAWLLVARSTWRPTARLASVAVMAAVVLLVTGAWLVRNRLALGVAALSTNNGLNLLQGNSEKATWNSGASTDISAYEPGAAGLDEVGRDAYYRNQALRFMRSHPGRTVGLYGLKVLNWFNYRNDLAQRSESSRFRDVLMLLTYGPLLLLFVARLVLIGRFRPSRAEALFLLLYVTNAFVYAIWHTRIRFRLPFDLLLIAVVAIFIGRVIESRRQALARPAPTD